MRRKIRQYLPALLLHIQRRLEGGRGVVVAVRTRDICGVDRRCGQAVRRLMMRLVEKGLARRYKKGVYIIERRAQCLYHCGESLGVLLSAPRRLGAGVGKAPSLIVVFIPAVGERPPH